MIDVGVRVADLLQEPVQKRLHLLVDVLADSTDLGFGDTALESQGGDQSNHLKGGEPTDVDLHDHAVEALLHPATGLEDRGQEAASPQFGDQQVDVTSDSFLSLSSKPDFAPRIAQAGWGGAQEPLTCLKQPNRSSLHDRVFKQATLLVFVRT